MSASAADREERAFLRRELLRQAWPVVLQNSLHTLMFYVDTYMIGRLGEEAMASMGVVGPIAHTITAIFSAISVGAVALVARAWGEGDREKQVREGASALSLAFLLGVPLTLIGVVALPAMASIYEVPGAPAVAELARGYLRYEGSMLLFYCLLMAATGILRGAGRTFVPLMVTLAGNLLNIALNWVLIYGNLGAPRMGVAGAGLATAISLALEGTVLTAYLFTSFSPVRLRLAGLLAVTRASIARLVRVSVPAAVEPLVLQSGFLFYNKLITQLGVTPMAAHRAAITVESLAFMPGWGLAVACSALVGQFLGAGRPDRAEASLREGTRLAVLLMSAVGVGFLAFSEPLARLFLNGPGAEPAVQAAALCLMICAFEQPFMALAMTLAGALRGAGETRSPVLVAVIGVWGVRVPLAWALAFPAGLGLTGIWITMVADWAVRSAVFAVILRRGRWKTLKL